MSRLHGGLRIKEKEYQLKMSVLIPAIVHHSCSLAKDFLRTTKKENHVRITISVEVHIVHIFYFLREIVFSVFAVNKHNFFVIS